MKCASNIARIANAVQCHSLMSGHYDSNVLMFSIVRNRQVDTGAINTNATKDLAAGIPDFKSVPAFASKLIS